MKLCFIGGGYGEIDKTKPVLVTGDSGYIASWTIKMLLEDGLLVDISTYATREKALNHDFVPLAERCA
jgi:nucleoside-diphosphate-sugar epimerase